MLRRSGDLRIVGYGLSMAYGAGLIIALGGLILSVVNQELVLKSPFFVGQYRTIAEFQQGTFVLWVLYFLQFIGLLAVLRLKEWGRKLVVAMNGVTCLYVLYRMNFLLQGADLLPLVSLSVYILVILFFSQTRIKEQFQRILPKIVKVGKTILVIDDDKGALAMIRASLQGRGFDVLTAMTGEQGIQITRKKKPDLIVLDVILPGIKGREVCLNLKKDPQTKEIPVIFLTAKDSPDDIKAELEAGGVSHLAKPFDSAKLLSEIKRILGV